MNSVCQNRRYVRSAPAPLVACALLTLALAGCAPSLELRDPSLPSPDAALAARGAALRSEPALTEEGVPARWWSLFDDPALAALEEEAARSNLDLLAAAARIEESRAQLGLANAARAPWLDGRADGARSAISENSRMAALGAPTAASGYWTTGLQAGWELDLWGRLRHQSDAAEARGQASEQDRNAVKVSIAAEVARTYLQLRGAQSMETIVKENLDIAENLVRMAESRERNGVATRFDAAAARADLAGVKARLAQLRHQRESLMNALALLLGKPPRELNQSLSVRREPSMPKRLPIGVPSDLARQRPDILRAEAQLRAALADIGAAEADFYPRISLTGGVGAEAFHFSDLGLWASRQFSIGPTLYLPIFQGGRLTSALALTEARHHLAGVAYQQTVLQAWREIDDALGAYAAEKERHAQLKIAMTQNRTALEVASRGYQQGSADFTSVLIARRSLLSSQAELSDCATASALSVVALYRALGGGWSPEIEVAAAMEKDPL